MKIPTPDRLYHYTSLAGAVRIQADGGLIRPGIEVIPEERHHLSPWYSLFVWLTDMEKPARAHLGFLDMRTDYLAARYVVTELGPVSWYPAVRRGLPRSHVLLEQVPGVKPAHWFLAGVPLHAEPDLAYQHDRARELVGRQR